MYDFTCVAPLKKKRAQLEPISSNGGRKISLFERRNFYDGSLINFFFLSERKDIVHEGKLFYLNKVRKRNVKFRRSGTLK